MSRAMKILIGLAAALLAGWIVHGPLGRGEAFVAALEAQARSAVTQSELPGISVRLERDPLKRAATVNGTANDLQREGLGSQWGVKDYVRAVPGISSVRWSDEPEESGLPLLVETSLLVALAFAVGLGLGALLARRQRRRAYLD